MLTLVFISPKIITQFRIYNTFLRRSYFSGDTEMILTSAENRYEVSFQELAQIFLSLEYRLQTILELVVPSIVFPKHKLPFSFITFTSVLLYSLFTFP